MDKVTEGSLYKAITVENQTFHIYYGYYSDAERERWDPVPIFPNFRENPRFTEMGNPYTRADQDICECYEPKPKVSGEDWCNDCIHFRKGEDVIGTCQCDKRTILRKNE